LLVIAFALRAALVLAVGDVSLSGDEVDYDLLARQLWHGEGFGYGQGEAFVPTSYRAPGHPAWLALLYAVSDGSLIAARLGQSVLMTGVTLVFFLLARTLFDARVAWVAAILIAFDPVLIAFSAWLWAEPLYLLVMGLAFLALLQGQGRGSVAWLLGSGLLWGGATLVRESGLFLFALLMLWLVWAGWRAREQMPGAAWRYPLPFMLGFVLALAPWTWRNFTVHGQFVPVTSVSGLALWLGNNAWGEWQPVFQRYFQPETEMAREALAVDEGLAAIGAAGMAWLPTKVVANWPALMGPENFLLRQLRDGAYGPISDVVYASFYAGTWVYWTLVGGSGLIGLWFSVRAARRALLVLPIVAVLVAHTVLHAHSRHRLPLVPILALGAAYAWVYRRPLLAQLRKWPPSGRAIGAVATVAVFVVLNVPFKQTIWNWVQTLW
jgi:hypothetical protein